MDENENKIGAGGDQDERLRQIWAKKYSSAAAVNELVKPIVTQHNKVGLNNNDPEFIYATKGVTGNGDSDNSLRKDDYGLRSLLRNINESVASLSSDSSSILNHSDLGMSKSHVEFYNTKEYRFPYMESPLTNNVVSPLSDYYKVPDEYLHGLAARQSLPKIELNRMATDLVRQLITSSDLMIHFCFIFSVIFPVLHGCRRKHSITSCQRTLLSRMALQYLSWTLGCSFT